MRVRYHVVTRDQQFHVYRESVSKGVFVMRNRAIDVACTMARLEARLARTASSVVLENDVGQQSVIAEYDPVSQSDRDSAVA